MPCVRCGNKSWTGLFPFCPDCSICGKCSGSGYYIHNGARCVICKGRGFIVKKDQQIVKTTKGI